MNTDKQTWQELLLKDLYIPMVQVLYKEISTTDALTEIINWIEQNKELIGQEDKCPDCNGTGDLSGKSRNTYEECPTCEGSGESQSIPQDKTIIEDYQLRIDGKTIGESIPQEGKEVPKEHGQEDKIDKAIEFCNCKQKDYETAFNSAIYEEDKVRHSAKFAGIDEIKTYLSSLK